MLSQEGLVRLAPLLKWREIPFREELAKQIPIPISIENDANAAALAEVYFGERAARRVDMPKGINLLRCYSGDLL